MAAGADLVGVAEIREAARLLAGVAVRTPLVPFPGLGRELLVKPESLQPTGSFKLRGAYTAISAAGPAAREHGVVAHSSGNHGHAVAYGKLAGKAPEDVFPQLVSSQLVRHIEPVEVARTISFLLSDDAIIIRGQAVSADGGDTPY